MSLWNIIYSGKHQLPAVFFLFTLFIRTDYMVETIFFITPAIQANESDFLCVKRTPSTIKIIIFL